MPKTQKYPIDLGKTMSDDLKVETDAEPKKYYPSVGFEWDTPYDIPESGEMTVTFKRTSETNSKRPDGKTSYRVELDLTGIKDVESTAEEDVEESTGDRLDKAKKAMEKKGPKRKHLPNDIEDAVDEASADEEADTY